MTAEKIAEEDLVVGKVAHVGVLLQRDEAGPGRVVLLLHELDFDQVEFDHRVRRRNLRGGLEIGLGLGPLFSAGNRSRREERRRRCCSGSA